MSANNSLKSVTNDVFPAGHGVFLRDHVITLGHAWVGADYETIPVINSCQTFCWQIGDKSRSWNNHPYKRSLHRIHNVVDRGVLQAMINSLCATTPIWKRSTDILCDLKHLIDLSKMKFLNNVSTSPIRILQCCIFQAMRSAAVKKLFYYYGVYTGCCVSFNTVFSKVKCALVV